MPNSFSIDPARWVRASTTSVTTEPSARAASAGGRPPSSRVRPPGPVTAKSTPWSGRPASHSTLACPLVTVAGRAGLWTASSGDQSPRARWPTTSRPVPAPSSATAPAINRRTLNLKLNLRRPWPMLASARLPAAPGGHEQQRGDGERRVQRSDQRPGQPAPARAELQQVEQLGRCQRPAEVAQGGAGEQPAAPRQQQQQRQREAAG